MAFSAAGLVRDATAWVAVPKGAPRRQLEADPEAVVAATQAEIGLGGGAAVGEGLFQAQPDGALLTSGPVSYTHLDVYKRQVKR